MMLLIERARFFIAYSEFTKWQALNLHELGQVLWTALDFSDLAINNFAPNLSLITNDLVTLTEVKKPPNETDFCNLDEQ